MLRGVRGARAARSRLRPAGAARWAVGSLFPERRAHASASHGDPRPGPAGLAPAAEGGAGGRPGLSRAA